MKKILGLDLGTNSVGWAVIARDNESQTGKILGLGSRIIPMDGVEMSNFKKGLAQTKNAKRRENKSARVGNKRYKQRRNKLIYVLQKLDMLPDQIRLSESFDNPKQIQKVNVLPIKIGTEQYSGKEFMELCVKAICEPVSAKEYGKILYRYNQLRGYAGGDDEDMQDELDDVLGVKSDRVFPSQENRVKVFKVLDYKPTEEEKKKKKVFNIQVEDTERKIWSGTTTIENITIGESNELKQLIRRNSKSREIISVEFSIPKKTGWRKKMENLEEALEKHSEEKGRKTYLSEYFLDCLNENEWQRIRDNVVLRSRYQEEFDAIWERQNDTHFKNISQDTIKEIAHFLFPGTEKNQPKFRKEAIKGGLKHIIRNQIIYYQRELQDQGLLISDCRFESGEKVVAKSHPLFQEYKIWEQINKLSINRKTQVSIRKNGKPKFKYEERSVSSIFKEYLFEQHQEKKELSFSTVFKKLKEIEGFEEGVDFFNGMSSKGKLVGNTTKLTLKKRMGRFWKILNLEEIENQIELWDILYNSKGNEYDFNSKRNKKITEYLKNKGVNDPNLYKIIIAISCIKFSREYASLSLKAVQKVLPLVRAGKYFKSQNLSENINNRIIKIINEHADDAYDKALQNYLETNESQVLIEGGFVNAYALMLLYGKHTGKEISDEEIIKNYREIKPLKRHSLRNPLVEQMINETLMVVKDIWREYGKPDEIKVELARELKNNIEKRKRIHEANENSRKTNERIKKRLTEFKKELSTSNIERYKLWETQVNRDPNYIEKYEVTKSEVDKMRLWEEQGHIDPYTGKTIPLTALFNKGLYDIDHIIPQSRYFDDSFGNKVICSQKVNKDKGNRTVLEYFEAGSTKCELLPKEVFMDNAAKKFFGKKRKLMLATKIPDDPIERQMKETQYISVKVKEELAKVVGSSNLKTSGGGVTHYLRNHWGITDVFKKLLWDRFRAYYELKAFSVYNKKQKDNDIKVKEAEKNGLPLPELIQSFEEFKKAYIKEHITYKENHIHIKNYSKRFDHRHHAMDALIVACTDEKAIKRLNDLNKHLQEWIKSKIENKELNLDPNSEDILEQFLSQESEIRDKAMKEIERFRDIEIPWKGFHENAKQALVSIIVSHKPKDKLLLQYDDNGNRVIKIRGQLHEDTIYGLSSGFESYRVPLSKFADANFKTSKNIENITNPFLKEFIREYFEKTHNGKKTEAFGAEGIIGLNKLLAEKNINKNGGQKLVPHPPIYSIKIYRKKIEEKGGYKISLQKFDRKTSYNDSLYVKTGNNYLFGVLGKNGKRIYDIISLFDAAQLLKDNFNKAKNKLTFDKDEMFKEYFENKNNAKLLFTLRHFDMVYLPDENEEVILDEDSPLINEYWKSPERSKNIYTVTKLSGKQIYFNQHSVAELIEKNIELGSQNMLESVTGRKIVAHCYPVAFDRLGKVKPAKFNSEL